MGLSVFVSISFFYLLRLTVSEGGWSSISRVESAGLQACSLSFAISPPVNVSAACPCAPWPLVMMHHSCRGWPCGRVLRSPPPVPGAFSTSTSPLHPFFSLITLL